MDRPIIGSEAIDAGLLTRGALRWNYRAILPDVYLPAGARRSILNRAYAAWLWTGRQGVIAGRTAAALYGVAGVEDDAPIEIIAKPRRAQPGVVVRDERLEADEIGIYGELSITTPARTAFDLARRLPRDEAVVHLDMLADCTEISRTDVAPLQQRYRTARGTVNAYDALEVMDGGSRSPEETRVRLWLIDAGLPHPQTSIPVADHRWESTVGIGWRDARVGVQWAEHRPNLTSDILFRDLLSRLGWQLIEVAPLHGPWNVVGRCRDALRRRGFR
ncbi:hypothetical protein [Mycobacterium sp. NAZ190054]|uniref:hypothetical protein n=1 Tax=Mycobacterium sp. NAZ190054 TaxID=1747766 RepID=UPI0007991CD7|nr:hypothetical protein [Mycobacterium sp. NAZ190054]KWX68548.1 hypothetical protein ASJ79_17255 [Mycobacterium sp. NAZ190054]